MRGLCERAITFTSERLNVSTGPPPDFPWTFVASGDGRTRRAGTLLLSEFLRGVPVVCCRMGNQNRKATKEEMARVRRVIKEAFPDLTPIFGSHGDYGGHRAPRDHTISFRLQDARGKFRSNVVWLMPDWLSSLTAGNIRAMVAEANGKRK